MLAKCFEHKKEGIQRYFQPLRALAVGLEQHSLATIHPHALFLTQVFTLALTLFPLSTYFPRFKQKIFSPLLLSPNLWGIKKNLLLNATQFDRISASRTENLTNASPQHSRSRLINSSAALLFASLSALVSTRLIQLSRRFSQISK